jgi:hypothetical protein
MKISSVIWERKKKGIVNCVPDDSISDNWSDGNNVCKTKSGEGMDDVNLRRHFN